MDKSSLNKIKEEVESFFQKMTFDVEVEVSPEKENSVPINIKASEPQILIGEGGQTLGDIQHLLKIILKRKLQEEQFFVDVDISDYKKKKNEYLRELARTSADEVALDKFEKALPPMSAYERRIVHMELAERKDVLVESQGEEPERRIVIKPI
jgi:spoIIIJ-associated protein